jgi:Haem-binding uptake, Tiki superfamily, ChaN
MMLNRERNRSNVIARNELLLVVLVLQVLWSTTTTFVIGFLVHDAYAPVSMTSLLQHKRIRQSIQLQHISVYRQETYSRILCELCENKEDLFERTSDEITGSIRLMNRRKWFQRAATISTFSIVPITTLSATAAIETTREGASSNVYIPAVRPTVYRVDSTIPPTLLPVPKTQNQIQILRDLGRGLGTNKDEVFVDRINLNNMLQKAVYGTINALQSVMSREVDSQKAPASFVCFGLPMNPTARDVELNVSLLKIMFEKRLSQQKKPPPSAIGIAILPCTMQNALDDLVTGRMALSDLPNVAEANGGDALRQLVQQIIAVYQPLFEYSIQMKIPMIAMGLSMEDKATVRSRGIQSVNPDSRARYVVDPDGFIATTNDPKFKLYTDRSLLKDRLLLKDSDGISEGNYFAERILTHEAGATIVSQYAIEHCGDDDCVIAVIAPINDVRYMGGTNGRIPRIYQHLRNAAVTPSTIPTAALTTNDITTILINPTATDTLSRTVRLRLEIGTGPDTLAYQTKIADYLWFTSSPPVNLLPRVMDY